MLETEFLIPNKADEIMMRLSQANTKLIDDDDDDSEGFQSAYESKQRLIADHQELIRREPEVIQPGSETFDTHKVDNTLSDMQLDTDLIEEAKQMAKQKADKSAMS